RRGQRCSDGNQERHFLLEWISASLAHTASLTFVSVSILAPPASDPKNPIPLQWLKNCSWETGEFQKT
ncbi:MAG: hypothetical protein AAB304_03420, partial [Pseudomonadota bacterium]